MNMQSQSLATVLAVAVMGIIVSASLSALVATRTIHNNGNVAGVGVGVYWDSGCTNEVSSIDWGTLQPGATIEGTLYLKNEGNVVIALSMTTDNWNPTSASSYMSLTWNRENYVLNVGSVVSVVLSLSVSSDIVGIADFSFDITVTGTEHT